MTQHKLAKPETAGEAIRQLASYCFIAGFQPTHAHVAPAVWDSIAKSLKGGGEFNSLSFVGAGGTIEILKDPKVQTNTVSLRDPRSPADEWSTTFGKG